MKTLFPKVAAIATAATIVDQSAKLLIRQSLDLCTAHSVIGCDGLDLVGPFLLIRVRNAGSAFGFFQGLWIWLPFAIAGLLVVVLYARSSRATAALVIAAGLQLGGAFGNLVDRLLLGGVTDFIYLGTGPVFNLADLALALGAVLASWSLASGFNPSSQRLQDTEASLDSTAVIGSAPEKERQMQKRLQQLMEA